ncbi:MAG: hypothetical protein IT370_14755 [Deltaproteobacteria bacterium]|nr:hypothetical protein [Deltaproteobacteria bacterium]
MIRASDRAASTSTSTSRARGVGRWLAVALLGVAVPAWGQVPPAVSAPVAGRPAAPVRKKALTLGELEAAVAELRAQVDAGTVGAADAAAARAAVGELEARVATLAADTAALQRAGATSADVRGVVDGLSARVSALESALSELRVLVALPPTPVAGAAAEAGAGGGGGPAAAGGIPMADEALNGNDVIFLASANGRIGMSLRGFMQLRYALDYAAAPDSAIVASGFSLQRARLIWSGFTWQRQLRVRLNAELAGSAVGLRDGFVEYQRAPALWLRGGQFKVPLSRQNLVSKESMLFVDRALAMDSSPLRDIGVSAGGALAGGKLAYQVGAFNGAGTGRGNDNIDLRYVGRVAVAPLGPVPRNEGDLKHTPGRLLEVAVAGMYDLTPTGDLDGDGKLDDIDGDGRVDNSAVYAVGASLVARRRGASIEAEYLGRREQEGAGRGTRTLHAWYVQGSYHTRWGWMLGTRMGVAEPSPVGLSQAARTVLPDQRWEVSLLAGWAKAGHAVRVQGEFTTLVEQLQGTPDRKVHRGLVQVQIGY